MPMTPQEHGSLWASRFGASGEKYKAGVRRTQGNPAQKAIAAKERCLQGFTDAITSGRWEAGLAQVTEAGWKEACETKGAPALATSARVAEAKVVRAEARIGPIRQQVVASLPPRGSIEENLERARIMAMRMHEARKRG